MTLSDDITWLKARYTDLQSQCVDLQSQLAFQEDTIEALNNVVTRQQQQIEHLNELYNNQKSQLQHISSEMERDINEEKPPHY